MTYRTGLVLISFILSIFTGYYISQNPGEGLSGTKTVRTVKVNKVQQAEPETAETELKDEEGEAIETAEVVVPRTGLKIGLSYDNLNGPRRNNNRELFVKEAEAVGAEVLFTSADNSSEKQAKDVDMLISKGISVLVVVPNNEYALVKAVDKAKAAGIRVIAYQRPIMSSNLDLYVGFDNERIGMVQARYITDRLPEAGRHAIIRLMGPKGDNQSRRFKTGQDLVLKPFVDAQRLDVLKEVEIKGWSRSQAKEFVTGALSDLGGNIFAILACSDTLAAGAWDALKERGLQGKIILTGSDPDLEAYKRLGKRTQSMSVFKSYEILAKKGAELAVRLAKGEDTGVRGKVTIQGSKVPTHFVEVDFVNITKLKSVLAKDNLYSEADILPAD